MPEIDALTHVYALLFWLALAVAAIVTIRFLRSFWGRPRIPWKLGSVTVDLIGGQDTVHAGLGGTSGKGKSSALIPLLAFTNKPVVAFGFDKSKPLEEWWEAHAHSDKYIHWKMDGTLGWNILDGPALSAAEGLTAGFERSNNDTGYLRGLVGNRLTDLIQADDEAGRPRNIWSYINLLRMPQIDGDTTRACKRWANSFEMLVKTLGPALGNDFTMSDALRNGKRILVMPNRFMRPETADLIGGIALVQVRRAAEEVGDFLVFIEEAGQARAYEKDISTLFQAGRTRGCPMVLITQNLNKLRDEVTNNIGVWVIFGQRIEPEAKAASTFTRVPPEEFYGLPRGTCWIRIEEADAVRVKLPLIRPPKPPRNPPVRLPDKKVPTSSSYVQIIPALPAPATEVTEIPKWVGTYEERQRIWQRLTPSEEPGLLWTPERGFWRDGRCLLWPADGATRGKKDPRPAAKIGDQTVTVYRKTYEWAGGTIPPSYEIDHLCGIPLCCNPEHGEAVTSQENIRRRDGRKKALASLDGG